MVADFLTLSGLRALSQNPAKSAQEFRFNDNRSFWTAAPRMFEGAPVRLEKFTVMEWAPIAPGRYYTPAAAAARRKARKFWDNERAEFIPFGKMNMMLGGVGSVRLKSITIAGDPAHFLGATSNGVSHEGIPLCVTRDLYHELIPMLKEHGASDCTVIGTIEIIPDAIDALDYALGLPRFVIRVRGIEVLRPDHPRSAAVTLSVLFLGAARKYETASKAPNHVGWTYATFDPCAGQADRELLNTTNWIKDYVNRHSVLDDPPVVCDFDQQVDHFSDDVLLRLDDIIRGEVDIDILRRLVRKQHLTINIEQVGDRFDNVVNSRIVNRATILAN